jgi:hypothetical protein
MNRVALATTNGVLSGEQYRRTPSTAGEDRRTYREEGALRYLGFGPGGAACILCIRQTFFGGYLRYNQCWRFTDYLNPTS